MTAPQDDFFKPGSLKLPASLSIEERAEAIGITRQMEFDLAEAMDRVDNGDSTIEEAQESVIALLNSDPAKMARFAYLFTGADVASASAVLEGLDAEGNWLISFALDVNEPDTDECSA